MLGAVNLGLVGSRPAVNACQLNAQGVIRLDSHHAMFCSSLALCDDQILALRQEVNCVKHELCELFKDIAVLQKQFRGLTSQWCSRSRSSLESCEEHRDVASIREDLLSFQSKSKPVLIEVDDRLKASDAVVLGKPFQKFNAIQVSQEVADGEMGAVVCPTTVVVVCWGI